MMKPSKNIVRVALALVVSDVQAMQQHHLNLQVQSTQVEATATALKDMVFVEMDQKDTDERGSYCLDGKSPGFYYREGSKSKKWILAFEGGEWCQTLDKCVDKIHSGYTTHGMSGAPGGIDSAKTDFSIFKSPGFHHYSHVVFHHCDAGLWMGDKEKPSHHKGHTLYFRGKRILDHLLDYLKTNTTFGSAEEVMITGGSGGGQATYLLSDYVSGLMPSTVTKYGAVPMDGWYASGEDSQKKGFDLHDMSSAIVPACRNTLRTSEWYKCLYSDIAYQHSKTPMFMIQLLDYNGVSRLGDAALSAWHSCLFENKTSCISSGVEKLQGFLDDTVGFVQKTKKYSNKNEGGFISTCTKHTFYTKNEYFHYAAGHVTIEKAVEKWWSNLNSAKATWYLPCKLNDEFPHQCESSCDFGTDGKDQHTGGGD